MLITYTHPLYITPSNSAATLTLHLQSVLHETKLNEMQKESLRMIISSGELLCAVVNDVLGKCFSRVHFGEHAHAKKT